MTSIGENRESGAPPDFPRVKRIVTVFEFADGNYDVLSTTLGSIEDPRHSARNVSREEAAVAAAESVRHG